jgi:hypothetical protein
MEIEIDRVPLLFNLVRKKMKKENSWQGWNLLSQSLETPPKTLGAWMGSGLP